MKKKLKINDLKSHIKDYKEFLSKKDIDIFTENVFEDVMLLSINMLNDSDKALIFLYSELKSYRKLGKELEISHQLIKNEITRIKNEIKNNINKLLKIYDN